MLKIISLYSARAIREKVHWLLKAFCCVALLLPATLKAHTDHPVLSQPKPLPLSDQALALPPIDPTASVLRKSDLKLTPADHTGGWTIDTTDRLQVRSFFNTVYQASKNTPMAWTGDVSNCNPGHTGIDYQNAVLARINYYRAMAGVPANIVFDPTLNAKAQQMALMMSAQQNISHAPPSSWHCYTADGADAAGHSNLSIGLTGWEAIDGQVRDNGDNNATVGHRVWLFLPQTETMGLGNVAASSTSNEQWWSANAVWVYSDEYNNPPPPSRDGFIAWPVKGYNPFPIVPIRWSFTYPNTDFSEASIHITQNDTTIPLSIDRADNWLVWRLHDTEAAIDTLWPRPSQDEHYTVHISNAVVNGQAQSFSYTVSIFDPLVAATDETKPYLTGNTSPEAGNSATYTINTVDGALGYTARIAEIQAETASYTANSGTLAILDHSSNLYELSYWGDGANGSTVYRLAPESEFEYFILGRTYISSSTSTLQFQSKLGYATTEQIASVDISIDGGLNWENLFSQTGSGQSTAPTDQQFIERNLPLSDYANQFVNIRFSFRHNGYHFLGHEPYVSFLVDNIHLDKTDYISSEQQLSVNQSRQISFTPKPNTRYALSAQAILWEAYTGMEWSQALRVKAAATTNEALTLQLRAYLQGAYDYTKQTMRDSLRALKLLPHSQPYATASFEYNGTETLDSALFLLEDEHAPVDWILVELRDSNNPSLIIAQQAALLQKNGDIVDPITAATTLSFPQVQAGHYYIALRHRNHLPVMSSNAQTLSHTPISLDFTRPDTAVYGTDTRRFINTMALMQAGDANSDEQLIASGPNNDARHLLINVLTSANNPLKNANYRLQAYLASDLNMDGYTLYAGANNDLTLLISNVLQQTANQYYATNYIVKGNLP